MRDLYTIPNLLSVTRIGLGVTGMLWIVSGSHAYLVAAAVLIIAAELTDLLDGYVARRMGTETELGRGLDTTCDAIFHLSIFLAFLITGWMPLWAAILIYSCEISLPYLRSFSKQFRAEPPARIFEQVKVATYGLSQLAVVLVAAFLGSDMGFHGISVVLAIFVVDVVVSLAVLFANVRPIVRAKLRSAGEGH